MLDWFEVQAGKGGDADVALLRMVEEAGREGSRGAEAWRGVRHSPGAVETLRINKMALFHTRSGSGGTRRGLHTPI